MLLFLQSSSLFLQQILFLCNTVLVSFKYNMHLTFLGIKKSTYTVVIFFGAYPFCNEIVINPGRNVL